MARRGIGRRDEGPLLRLFRKLTDRTNPIVAVMVFVVGAMVVLTPLILFLGPLKAPLVLLGFGILVASALELYEWYELRQGDSDS